MDDAIKQVGRLLQHVRSELGLNIDELAQKLGRTGGLVWKWENGRGRLGLSEREQLLRFFGTLGAASAPSIPKLIAALQRANRFGRGTGEQEADEPHNRMPS